MPTMTLQQAFELAVQHHRAGRAAEAESIYQQILVADARNIATLQMLAQLYYQMGQGPLAAATLERAIAIDPRNPDYHSNLGSVLAGLGRVDEAIAAVRRAIELKPHSAELHGNLGNTLLARGEVNDAIAAYRQALALKPDAAEIVSNLGNALRNKGDLNGAIESYRRAVELRPQFVEARVNLGHALKEAKRYAESIEAYRQAIRVRHGNHEAHIGLGHALAESDLIDEALAEYRKALAIRADAAEAWYGIGSAHKHRSELDEAIAAFREAVRIRPTYADAHSNLGIAIYETGDVNGAIAAYEDAIAHNPQFPEAHNNLGVTLQAAGRVPEAVAALQRALALRPNYADALNNLGLAYDELGNIDEAIAAFRRAVAIMPDSAHGWNNLANALKETGQLDQAIEIYRDAARSGGNSWLLGNLLFALHAHSDYGPEELYREHLKWSEEFGVPLKKHWRPHDNDRSPERCLRIGFVSPDFNQHPVGRFLMPLMMHRDRSKFQLYCYSDGRRVDWMSEKFEALADVWRKTLGMSDEKVDALVRDDRIDILIDLTMHTKDGRLSMFARKPAPVQATYLAYCGTTGLDAIDYRITDPYLDPVDSDDSLYAEKSVRLPHSYWCYQAPPEAGDGPVSPSPVGRFGSVTFGCLNSFTKVRPEAIAAWGRIIVDVPGSRLLLHCREGSHRHHVSELFLKAGVQPHRVQFVGKVSGEDYFRLYHQIDIGLDPFPYPGGTTTCDALWMGVPVITLKGRTAVSRGGFSILSNIGLIDLVANSTDQYVDRARGLANDPARLADLRAGLRERMMNSKLMDEIGFTRDFEQLLRGMWRDWCAKST